MEPRAQPVVMTGDRGAMRYRFASSKNFGSSAKPERRFTRRPEADTLRFMKAALAEPEIITKEEKPVSVILPEVWLKDRKNSLAKAW